MYRLALGLSIALHIALFALILTGKPLAKDPRNFAQPSGKKLEVRSVSAKELDAELAARQRLQNTGQIVHSDEQLKSVEAPTTKTQKIFLSEFNQRVDRNTKAPRAGDFKNVLDEGLGTDDKKKVAGAEAVQAKKQKNSEKFDAKNLFALASNYDETQEGRNDAAAKGRTPASVLRDSKGGKKGDGLSATDDFLEGVNVGANTLLNTQEFKFYGFYQRVRALLVERWRSRIRREIDKARRPAADGSVKLTVGVKSTKLQVTMGPNGEVKAIERLGISGIDSFDTAAEISFREAGPYPHPPREMLKNDELTIKWDFVVVVEDAALVQFNVNASP